MLFFSFSHMFSKINYSLLIAVISTIPPTIALILSYKQIKQFREAELNQDKKVAVDNSIKYVDRFAKTVLPHFQEYKALANSNKISVAPIPSTGFDNFDYTEVQDLLKKEKTGIYGILNELDIIAAAILRGQVDNEVCRDLVGSLYCEAVEVYYDLICFSRIENKQHFKMTVKLYAEWRKHFSTVQSPVNEIRNNSLLEKITG